MTISNQKLLSILKGRIASNLNRYFPELQGETPVIEGKKWGGKGTARTFRLLVRQRQGAEKVLFAKLSPVTPEINFGFLEFQALKFLHPILSSSFPQFGVPKPLDFFHDLNAMVMESVGSTTLKKYLLRMNHRGNTPDKIRQIKSMIERCGKWLSLFHNLTAKGNSEPFRWVNFLRAFEAEGACTRALALLSPELDSRLESFFEAIRPLDGRLSMPCAICHCDFSPGHIFVRGDSINVIDITGIPDVPIFDDIGKWLATSSTLNAFPFAPGFDYSLMSRDMAEAFLQSYARNSTLLKNSFEWLSNLYRLKYLMLAYYSQYQRVSERSHPLIGRIFARFRLKPLFNDNIQYVLESLVRGLEANQELQEKGKK